VQIENQYIHQMIAGMSLDEEVGQMLVVSFDGTAYDGNDDLQHMIVNLHAGGIILYRGNLVTQAQVTALDAGVQQGAAQSGARIPLFISMDQEGGQVNRLQNILGDRPSAADIAATGDPNKAYQQGVSDGQILKHMGVNLNLAPVVDVQLLTDAQYNATSMRGFGTRVYGTTPDVVSTYAGAYLTGLQAQGVIGCLKHWPGLGSSTADPHSYLPVITRTQAELNNVDFAPYKTLLAKGNVEMIMSTHVLEQAYDPNLPATLSPIVIDQVLRHDLGYQGVVVTDALDMHALDPLNLGDRAVKAVQAGNDLLLGLWNSGAMQTAIDALKAAITHGTLSKASIDQSVQRILSLKIKYGLIKVPGLSGQG
jgi:beta-N-acetylhexosaminidase